MKEIWAVEPNFILGYLDKKENYAYTEEEIKGFIGGQAERVDNPIMIVDGDTAIIEISGPLSRKGPSFWDILCGYGGTAYNDIIEALGLATSDEMVKEIRLKMNTPGGTVDGCDEVAQMVAECGKKKTIIAENHGMIASAGYWIASQANKIIAISPGDETGSIGVIVVGFDYSEAYKEMGIKKHYIVSENAPRKVAVLDTKNGRDIIQDRVDAVERIFISRVAEGRGISAEDVRKKFGRGDIFVAEDPAEDKDDALSVGMIDKVVNSIVVNSNVDGNNDSTSANARDISDDERNTGVVIVDTSNETLSNNSDNDNKSTGDIKMTVKSLKDLRAEDPSINAEVEAIEKAEFAKGQKSGSDKVENRVKKATAFIGGGYPKAIQDLALKVVKGESEFSSLEAVATMHDAQKESTNSEEAQVETEETTDTPPGAAAPSVNPSAIETDADMEAGLNEARKLMGRA